MMSAMGTNVEGEIDVRRTRLQRAWRRVSRRSDGRSPLWIEILIIAWLFWLYDVINDFAPIRHVLALRNGTNLWHLERTLGINVERTLNRWLAGHATLSLIASYYYFFAHAVVTFAVLVLLWLLSRELYPRLRTQLVFINLIAFAVFWRYPLAPPRTFADLGFIDVIARSHALVSWHSGVLVRDADQYAAMPSLHIAWATWSAMAVWQLTRVRAVRVLAVAYPLVTTFVVLATGNHYVLDVLAGALTVVLAVALQTGLSRLLASRRLAPVAANEPARHPSHEQSGTATADAAPAQLPAQP